MILVTRLRYAGRLTRDVLYYADTSQVRWLMAIVSCVWGVELLSDPTKFGRPIYRLMVPLAEVPLGWVHLDGLVSAQTAWAFSFIAYGVAGLWRIYEGRPRRYWGLVVNLAGFAVWFASTLAMALALSVFAPSIAAEWIFTVQLLLIAVRGGLNDEVTSP